jgi:transposase
MNDTELYRQILGIESPWQVARVELNVADEAVRVFVEYNAPQAPQAPWHCPECGQPAQGYDQREERTWRHLDSCQFKTFLIAAAPRVQCPVHGVQTIPVPWSAPHSRFTLLFERFAIDVLQATQVQAKAARLLRLSPGQMHDLMARAVLRGLSRRDNEQAVAHLCLDEKSFQNGHQFISVLGDSDEKRVLEVVEGRTQKAAETLLSLSLSPAQQESVESVSMDMWPAFMGAREKVLPQAETVHDRFHIASYLSEALDKTRRAENNELSKQDDKTLHKTKYLWLRSPENLTDKQRAAFAALEGLELETAKVWAFKESFRQFFTCQSEFGAQHFFWQWYDAALALGNVHLTKVAQMLCNHLDGLLAYIRHRVSNGIAEGMNSQIQQIKASARGFRKFANFRVAILFFLGKLDLYPQESL